MTRDEAVNFFGTQTALAEALGITQPTIAEWKEYPPEIRQVQIERITKGKLKAEPSCYLPKTAHAESGARGRA